MPFTCRRLSFRLAAFYLCATAVPGSGQTTPTAPGLSTAETARGGLTPPRTVSAAFTTKAQELIDAKQWPEAKALLVDGIRQMPPDWTPIEAPADTKSPLGRVVVHSWDSGEYLAFARKHPAWGGTSSEWIPPSYSHAYYLLAYAEEGLGDLAAAMDALDRGLKLEPDHPLLIAEEAYVYQVRRQYVQALKLYSQAADVRIWAPDDQLAHALRGQGYCLTEMGQFDAAEAAYRKSLELQPGNLTAINELGYISRRRSAPAPTAAVPNSGGAARPQVIRTTGNVQQSMLVKKVDPIYPPLARQMRIQGIVSFSATIGIDGTVVGLTFLSGPAALKDAAAEAVRQWVYKPTLLNGQAFEVVAPIAVHFTLQ